MKRGSVGERGLFYLSLRSAVASPRRRTSISAVPARHDVNFRAGRPHELTSPGHLGRRPSTHDGQKHAAHHASSSIRWPGRCQITLEILLSLGREAESLCWPSRCQALSI